MLSRQVVTTSTSRLACPEVHLAPHICSRINDDSCKPCLPHAHPLHADVGALHRASTSDAGDAQVQEGT